MRDAKSLSAALAAAAAGLLMPAAQAACLSDVDAARLVANGLHAQLSPNPEGLTVDDGRCSRAKVNRFLQQQLGEPVGYKAGLTNPAVQKRFNHGAPVRGTLYAPMLLKDGATIDAQFGARPVFESDLLVRVSDARIAQATSPQEVLKYIDQVIPFIELPDLVVQAPSKLDGPALIAINVGARHGVLGVPIAVQPGLADALRDMQVTVTVDGAQADTGKGSDVLGHPLNAVLWLVQDLKSEGRALKKGDLLSLGSFSKLTPPKPGQAVVATYRGLPGDPSVRVNFR